MFGRETGIAERTARDIFWDFYIMYKVLSRWRRSDFDNVQDSFRAHVQLACSGVACMTKSGMYQYFDKTPDHLEPECAKCAVQAHGDAHHAGVSQVSPKRQSPTRAKTRSWCAWARRGRKITCGSCATGKQVIFMHNLRKGQLSPEEKQQVEAQDVWGFVPKFEKFPKIV